MSKPIQGLFWAEPPKASKHKAAPPDPVWLRPDYLPGLEEARAFNVPLMSREDLNAALAARETLVADVEIYENYFLAAFMSTVTGKTVYFELCEGQELDLVLLKWILANFTIVTFNGNFFDLWILALACAGKPCATMKSAANMIINQGLKGWQVLRSHKVQKLKVDHYDLIEVAPLQASLKIYGGRLHVPKMQDLPFPPETVLTPDQTACVRWYCINSDCVATAFVNEALKEQLEVRRNMSAKYGLDLRSKSDAQLAEAVICSELTRLNGVEPERPDIFPGTAYAYAVPPYVRFETPVMQSALEMIRKAQFVVNNEGGIDMPAGLKDFEIRINKGVYRMGIGGLHSSEKCAAHFADENTVIIDRDVTSYYPALILNQGLFPRHLGPNFLTVYRSLVERRVAAKKNKNKIEADMLKIVVNGSYGKLGSKWSALYAPDLMIQVTLTGQLCLLMLIEALEIAGIEVISANTDGIVFKCPKARIEEINTIVAEWEKLTGLGTEETRYLGVFSRDVNNYIAVKETLKTKNKGCYFSPWDDPGNEIFRFHKNPEARICIEAVNTFLTAGTPIEETIRSCRDITKFISVKKVSGGAFKDGVYLGSSIRWYYSESCPGPIIYATGDKAGDKVGKSDGARPCMELPEEFPGDVDFEYYVFEASEMLKDIGYVKKF